MKLDMMNAGHIGSTLGRIGEVVMAAIPFPALPSLPFAELPGKSLLGVAVAALAGVLYALPVGAQTQPESGSTPENAVDSADESSQTSVDVVARFFDALGRGDAEGMLALMADDIRWRVPGDTELPWVGDHQGKPAVLRFLQTFASELEPMPGGAPPMMVVQDQNVVVLSELQLRVRRNGRMITGPVAIHLQVRDGLIAVYDVYEDSFAVSHAWHDAPATKDE